MPHRLRSTTALTVLLAFPVALAGGAEQSATLSAAAQPGTLDIDSARIHSVSVGRGIPMLLLHSSPLNGELRRTPASLFTRAR